MNQETVEQFLQALTALTEQYGLIIESCGCCISPWLTAQDTGERVWQSLDWHNGKYDVEEVLT